MPEFLFLTGIVSLKFGLILKAIALAMVNNFTVVKYEKKKNNNNTSKRKKKDKSH